MNLLLGGIISKLCIYARVLGALLSEVQVLLDFQKVYLLDKTSKIVDCRICIFRDCVVHKRNKAEEDEVVCMKADR